MRIHLYRYDLPAFADISILQWDGQECVYCPSGTVSASEGAMKPVGHIHSSQVFAHLECAESHKWED
jgi:hypothetical protein